MFYRGFLKNNSKLDKKMQKAKKDFFTKLSVRDIRLEAKKLSIHLYSRKNKEDLVDLILKDREKVLIEDKTNDEVIAEEERIALENAKAEEERIALENAKAEEELNINSDKNSNLKRLLSESFPNKKILITDNKDGSQTILIH